LTAVAKAALEADRRLLGQYTEAYESMQEVTDQQEINGMINNFIVKEAENFALFNYVSELNGEIESLHDDLNAIQADVTKLCVAESNATEEHKEKLEKLQVGYVIRAKRYSFSKFISEISVSRQITSVPNLCSISHKKMIRIINILRHFFPILILASLYYTCCYSCCHFF